MDAYFGHIDLFDRYLLTVPNMNVEVKNKPRLWPISDQHKKYAKRPGSIMEQFLCDAWDDECVTVAAGWDLHQSLGSDLLRNSRLLTSVDCWLILGICLWNSGEFLLDCWLLLVNTDIWIKVGVGSVHWTTTTALEPWRVGGGIPKSFLEES